MTKTADELVVGANGSIYTAPVGSTVPASIATALNASWLELGYATEDGVKWTDGKTVQPIRAWQSFYDLRRIITERMGSLVFSLMQWNGETVKLAYGGGEITEPTSGAFRYTPPAPEEVDERMLAVEWVDGAYDFRLIFPKGMVSENVETTVTRTAAGLLPITFALLGEEGEEPFILDTNHPAFAASVGS